MTAKKVLMIVNPVSGVNHKKKQLLITLAQEYLKEPHFALTVATTNFAGHAIELTREAVEQQSDLVVAVGGDGSINEIAQVLAGTQTALAIVPLGSGNGLAHFLKIPFDLKRALNLVAEGNVIKADTVSLNDHFFVSVAGVGFDALVARRFALEPRRGFFSYLKVVVREYFRYRPKKYHIVADGVEIVTRALFITFANSDQFGYKTTISPTADICDGKVDICIVQKIPFWRIPQLAWLTYTRRIDRSSFVQIVKASEATITRKKGKYLNLDGEPVKLAKSLHLKVNPASLKIIVPPTINQQPEDDRV
ncbi:MAG: YegS/Rv2252/BmrU family lipid kinase [Bacteroidales bacterium]|jgi:YegS/Rv2252/BmrU family lipid kinase|nr:YegS/Rv2252/BmrU family lipid kinase [Bacteroidales bacterium]MDD3666006.1 YegS/Rv2252/BmrU family lipid kinase [Bacteroidales bacterium]